MIGDPYLSWATGGPRNTSQPFPSLVDQTVSTPAVLPWARPPAPLAHREVSAPAPAQLLGPKGLPVAAVSSSIASQVLTYDELMALPDPEPLIDDVLDLDSANWIIGQPGSFKSFFSLDMACHVATGRNWRGKGVRKGPVLYVCAEGARGIRKRVAAWAKKYGEVPQNLRMLPVAVQSVEAYAYGRMELTAQWREVIDVARGMGAVLIVLDTQARLTEGLDENAAKEMGVWVKAVDELKRATRGCVLVVHHTTKTGDTERGSSAIRGAADRTWLVEKSGMTALLSNPKSKDSGDSGFFSVDMEEIDLGLDQRGRPVNSLVLGADKVRDVGPNGDVLTATRARDLRAKLNDNQRWVVQTLVGMDEPTTEFDKGGATRSEIRFAMDELRLEQGLEKMPRATYYGVLKQLLEPFPGETKPVLFKVPKTQRLTLEDPESSLLEDSQESESRTERTLSLGLGQKSE